MKQKFVTYERGVKVEVRKRAYIQNRHSRGFSGTDSCYHKLTYQIPSIFSHLTIDTTSLFAHKFWFFYTTKLRSLTNCWRVWTYGSCLPSFNLTFFKPETGISFFVEYQKIEICFMANMVLVAGGGSGRWWAPGGGNSRWQGWPTVSGGSWQWVASDGC